MQHPSPYHRRSLRASYFHTFCSLQALLALVLVALLLCFPIPAAKAQLIPDSQWAVFRQTDGLLASDLHAVLPTPGAVWFGGSGGVSRFDGTWTTFPIDATAAPTAPAVITALALDDDRNLVVGARDGSLYRLVQGEWESSGSVGAPVHALQTIDNMLWVGAENGLTVVQGDVQHKLAALDGVAVFALQPTADQVWVGAADGLWRVTPTTLAVQPFAAVSALQLPAGAVTALTQDAAGALWAGIDKSIVQLRPHDNFIQSYDPYDLVPNATQITAIGVGDDETVWVATDVSGVVKYSFENGKPVSSTNLGSEAGGGLDTDNVRDLAIDAEGAIWFATAIGASRHYPWAWVGAGDRLSGLPITDMVVDAAGELWIATDGEGVMRLANLYAEPIVYYPGLWALADASVTELATTQDGQVWAATQRGLSLFADGAWLNPIPVQDLPAAEVTALAVDATDLWIGTAAGLVHYSFATQTLAPQIELAQHALQDLRIDGAGRLWALAADGTFHIRQPDGRWMPDQEALRGLPPNARVEALTAAGDQSHVVYAATANAGIYRWTGSRWEQYGPHDEWLDGRILTLALDANGRSLWIGSSIGVGRLDEVGLSIYDARDGAASGSIRSIVLAKQGGYWFGGQKGLWRFRSEPSAPLLLPGAIVGGTQQADGLWQIDTDLPQSLYFETGDIHSTADRIQVFYRLSSQGQVGAWQLAKGRSIRFAFATPGLYAVDIVARDLSFNYSEPMTHMLSVVAAPRRVDVPFLGVMEAHIFMWLAGFAAVAMVGLGYVSYEYLRMWRRTTAAVRRRFNPYISGEPVRRGEMFFGRGDLVTRIIATLHNNSIMIHGERRIGKTTLLYQLANVLRTIQDNAYWFLPVFVDIEGTAESELFHLLMEEIVGAVDELPALNAVDRKHIGTLHYWTESDATYDDRMFGRDLRTLMSILEEYAQTHQQGRQVRLILLLDEMDTLSRFDRVYQQQLRRIFMRDFAATLGAIVAGIELSKEWDRVESPWFNLFNEIEIQPLTQEAAKELLVKPVQHFYRYDDDALAFILVQSDGRPFRVQQYGLESVNHMLRERRRRITMVDVLHAHNLIQSEQNMQAAQAGLTKTVQGEQVRPAPTLLSPT